MTVIAYRNAGDCSSALENNWLGIQSLPTERFAEIQFCLWTILLDNFVVSVLVACFATSTKSTLNTWVSKKEHVNDLIYANNIGHKLDAMTLPRHVIRFDENIP